MRFRLAITWRVGLHQSPPPLRQPRLSLNRLRSNDNRCSAIGKLSKLKLSHSRGSPQSLPIANCLNRGVHLSTVCQMCTRPERSVWEFRRATTGRARGTSRPLSAWVALHFPGTLFAHPPRHDIEKLAIARPGLADAGSAHR